LTKQKICDNMFNAPKRLIFLSDEFLPEANSRKHSALPHINKEVNYNESKNYTGLHGMQAKKL